MHGAVLQALHSTRGRALHLGPCHLAALAPLSEAQALAVLQQWAKRGGADDSLQLMEYLQQLQGVHRANGRCCRSTQPEYVWYSHIMRLHVNSSGKQLCPSVLQPRGNRNT